MFEKEINLLPQELRKKEKEIREKRREGKEIPILIHKAEQTRVEQPKDKRPRRFLFPLPAKASGERKKPLGQVKRFFKRVWEGLKTSKKSLKITRKEEEEKSLVKKEEKKAAEALRKEERKLKEKEKEEPPELKVTLLPEEFLRLEDTERRLVRIIIAAGISLFLVGLSYFSLHLYGLRNEKKKEELNRETEEINQEIKSFSPIREEYGKIEERIEALQKLLKEHPSWTSFLSFLEKYTLPQVSYKGLSADLSGSFSLEARAPDIESVVWQVLAFRDAKDFVSEVEVSSIKTQEAKGEGRGEGVNFTISLRVQPGVFYK